MKNLLNALLLVLFLCGVLSCKNELESMECGNHRSHNAKDKPMIKTIRMSFGGDYISESEEPLVRAEDGNTYVGINVFRKELNKQSNDEEIYAYGLFSKTNDLSIDLVSGYTYKFEVSIIVEIQNKDKLALSENRGYSEPFRLNSGSKPTSDYNSGNNIYLQSKVDKGFQYSYKLIEDNKEPEYFCQLKYGTAFINTKSSLSGEPYSPHPRVKRYYGEKEYKFDYSVTSEEDEIKIDLKYLCFGLKLILGTENLAGNLTIEDVSSKNNYEDKSYYDETISFPKDLTFNDSNKEYDEVYSLYNLYAAYRDFDNYSETFTLKFIWNKAEGVNPETFNKTITVHPQKKKILHINLKGNPVSNTKGNIILTLEDDPMGDEEIQNINNMSEN